MTQLKGLEECENLIFLTTLAKHDQILNTTTVSLVVLGVGDRCSVKYSLPEVLTEEKLPFGGRARSAN